MADDQALGELEKAELAARARRLEAEAEAEQILEAAQARVGAIAAGVDDQIAAAVELATAASRRRAGLAVAAIEAQLAELEDARRGSALEGPPLPSAERPTRGFESAVELVVAGVLGEPGREV